MLEGPDLEEVHAYLRSVDGPDIDLRHISLPK
jgi:hypothetical protein